VQAGTSFDLNAWNCSGAKLCEQGVQKNPTRKEGKCSVGS